MPNNVYPSGWYNSRKGRYFPLDRFLPHALVMYVCKILLSALLTFGAACTALPNNRDDAIQNRGARRRGGSESDAGGQRLNDGQMKEEVKLGANDYRSCMLQAAAFVSIV